MLLLRALSIDARMKKVRVSSVARVAVSTAWILRRLAVWR